MSNLIKYSLSENRTKSLWLTLTFFTLLSLSAQGQKVYKWKVDMHGGTIVTYGGTLLRNVMVNDTVNKRVILVAQFTADSFNIGNKTLYAKKKSWFGDDSIYFNDAIITLDTNGNLISLKHLYSISDANHSTYGFGTGVGNLSMEMINNQLVYIIECGNDYINTIIGIDGKDTSFSGGASDGILLMDSTGKVFHKYPLTKEYDYQIVTKGTFGETYTAIGGRLFNIDKDGISFMWATKASNWGDNDFFMKTYGYNTDTVKDKAYDYSLNSDNKTDIITAIPSRINGSLFVTGQNMDKFLGYEYCVGTETKFPTKKIGFPYLLALDYQINGILTDTNKNYYAYGEVNQGNAFTIVDDNNIPFDTVPNGGYFIVKYDNNWNLSHIYPFKKQNKTLLNLYLDRKTNDFIVLQKDSIIRLNTNFQVISQIPNFNIRGFSSCFEIMPFLSNVIYIATDSNNQSVVFAETAAELSAQSTSIQKVNIRNDIILYPNPSSGSFKIISTNKIKSISIINGAGQRLETKAVNTFEATGFEPDNGLYFIQVITDKGVANYKFIVNH